jgi:hypothetical protein
MRMLIKVGIEVTENSLEFLNISNTEFESENNTKRRNPKTRTQKIQDK